MKERKQKDPALKQNPVKAPKPAKAQKVPKAPKVPKEKKEKKTGLHSMRFNVVQLVLLSIIISVASLLIMIIPVADNAISTLAESYMRDVCDTCGLNVDAALNRSGNIILNQAYLETLIGDVCINDLDSSYAYVVGSDGTMIYHPDESKVGQPVENAAIKQVVADLEAGKEQQKGMAIYEFRGAEKYAAYYVTSNKAAILVITADRGDILSSKDAIYARAGGAAVVIFIILGILSFLIASKMTRPIVEITNVIKRFSSLNFAESPTTIRISKRKDETGQMARAIGDLREKLVTIVSQIKSQSELLYNASTELDTNASHTTSTVGNVETAVNEIATGATNQASETQKATDDIVNMGNMIEHTNSQVENLTSTANLMRESSEEAAATLKELDNINQQAIASIDVIYEQTNITNISALKIKEATTLISSIAEETNLLSLNASIEAARAGEAGRGFAVVASQIQKLADQSNESANQIDQIIHALIEDSEKAVKTMDEVKTIMNLQSENVHKTGQVFEQVRDGISSSISGVGEIATRTTQLDKARGDVVDVVQNLTAIAQQNAASTEETSASVMEVSNVMQEIMENANRLKEIASILEENMNSFTL
ncbi:MAG TPA: methyl-accepting chemotaxis protein [Roseburia sp.]|nr:methyl-accepting chemotaxis protein [Roseburia sp.]